MSELQRVMITGLGAVTASGLTADLTWDGILSGRSDLSDITQWDLSSWTHRLGGEIKNASLATMLPDRKLLKVISRQDVFGINAATQAILHSGLLDYRDTLTSCDEFNEKTAVYVGSPANKYFQQYDFLPLMAKTGGDLQQFAQHLFEEVHPMWLLRILPNNVLAYVGISYGFKGPNHNIANHAVGGTQALIEAYHAIRTGLAKRAIVVAYDVAIEPQSLFYYEKLGVISARHLKPFDSEHDGTILAEGAAAIVLESADSAKERLATCYGEILGGNSASEASGLFSIEEDGSQLAQLMMRLLTEHDVNPDEVACIVAHGNGNKKSDISEASAIAQVFNDTEVPVTAFKWAMGHTICASGILDAVLACYALRERCIPGIANLNHIAPSCSHLQVQKEHRIMAQDKNSVVLINRGYSSMNACLLIHACHE